MLPEVMCHLLHIFFTHVHIQHFQFLSPDILLRAIISGECPDFLCFAICAASCRFSSHPIIRQSYSSSSLDTLFAFLARQALHQLKNHDISRVQALCVLIQYDATNGRGKQAWVDSGKHSLPEGQFGN